MLIADGIDPNELLSTMAAVKAGTKPSVLHVRLNIAMLTKMVKPKPGPVRPYPGCDQKAMDEQGKSLDDFLINLR